MFPTVSLRRRLAQWEKGVVHATLDPKGPGVVRLHLIPPKPSLLGNPPHLLFINGWHVIPLGPSWAELLRNFITVLNEDAEPGVEISRDKMQKILDSVVKRTRRFYPGIPADLLMSDLNEIVSIATAIAHGKPVPAEVQTSMTLRGYAKHMRGPHRMDLVVSPMVAGGEWLCPLHCKNCYAAGTPLMNITEEMSTTDWKRVIALCREIGIPQITFTGGEPTARKDLVELVEAAKWHITRLNTNGVTMTPKLAQELYQASLDGVQITLYSHDPLIHDALVGQKGAWQLTVKGIENALSAGLSVSVNTPLVLLNRDYGETLKFLRGLGIRYVTCSGLIPTGAARERVLMGEVLTSEQLMVVLKEATTICSESGMEISFTSPGWLLPGQLETLGLSYPVCGACLSNMAVAPNGVVIPCQSWLSNPDGLGNILTTPWYKIWNSPPCRRLRSREETNECPLKED